MAQASPAGDGAAVRRTRPSPVIAVLVALATVVLGVFSSAALADLEFATVSFARALPVFVMGEGLIYLLMLGGGGVAAPALFTAWAIGFIVRAGFAMLAQMLSPVAGAGDLFAGWQFYYAAYWPAAVASVLLVACGLRLIRPVIARRRRLRRPKRAPAASGEPIEDSAARREQLLAALTDSPDAPPESTTVLEERQLGDLAEPVEEDEEEPSDRRWEMMLPLLEEEGDADEPGEEPAPAPEAIEPEPTVPAEPVAPLIEIEDAVAADDVEDSKSSEASEPDEPAIEDTAKLDPVTADDGPTTAQVGSLQSMIDVVASRTSSERDLGIRVWRTGDQRTVLAAIPAGPSAADASGCADAVVRGHVAMCRWLGESPTVTQVLAADAGACSLRALDEDGGLLVMAAGTGEDAAERLPGVVAEVADALAELAGTIEAPLPNGANGGVTVEADEVLARAVSDAAGLGGALPSRWSAFAADSGLRVAIAAPEGADPSELAVALAGAVDAAADFVAALQLGELSHLALTADGAMLTACAAELAGGPGVLAALTPSGPTPGLIADELRRVASETSP